MNFFETPVSSETASFQLVFDFLGLHLPAALFTFSKFFALSFPRVFRFASRDVNRFPHIGEQ
jgi:hypothetical protein